MKRGRGHPPSSQRLHVLSLSMSPEPSRRGSPGNNRYGARGTLKCLNCRNRKARCEFGNQDDDCRWCATRGLNCGPKLLGEKHQIREHRKLLGIGNTPLSEIAAKLELAYPRHTPWEISELAREVLLESGDGPDILVGPSRSGSASRDDKSLTPRIDRAESVKLENSPKTPTLSLQGQTFLSASQKTPPRSGPLEPRSSSIMEQLPTYDFSVQYAVPLRHHQFEEREPSYDPGFFSQRIIESAPWSLQGLTWQETV